MRGQKTLSSGEQVPWQVCSVGCARVEKAKHAAEKAVA
jgi:hypothetical protein